MGDRIVVQGSQQCRNPSLHFPSASALFWWSQWVTLSGAHVKILISISWLFPESDFCCQRMPAGHSTDKLSFQINWEGYNFSHLCVWVHAAVVSLLPLHRWTYATNTPPFSRFHYSVSLWENERDDPYLNSPTLDRSGVASLRELLKYPEVPS